MKKQILVTNDDGFDAIGIKYLVEALKPLARVIVVAPSQNKSACAHSMTLSKPLRFKKIEEDFYRLNDGTPTDCIFLGLNHLYPKNISPDLIISGINMGSNMGEDITYSGTVAGATEGVLQGIPSISISQVYNNLQESKTRNDWDFTLACEIIVDLVKKIFGGEFPLKERRLLNVNIPHLTPKQYKGIKITKAGHRVYGNDCRVYNDPKGQEFHWIGLHPLIWEESDDKDCDFEAINNGYVSITPIKLDMTSYDDIKKLEKWVKTMP